jgi:hypothetical protein
MNERPLGFALLTLVVTLLIAPAAGPAHAQDCATGKPATISAAVPRAIGTRPAWMTAESLPIKWTAAATPVQLIWIVDTTVRGPVLISGKHRDSGAPVKFTRLGDIVGKKELRRPLDRLGYQPSQAKPQDFEKYFFDRMFGWFPAAGCYEMTARIGTKETKIFVQAVAK